MITPGIRLTPAMRAAKSLRGDISTVRTGPLSTIRPRSKMITLSAIARASSRSWVTMTAVRLLSRRMSRSSRRSAGAAVTSSADIGSSRSSTCGSAASARATATRWAWPPDSCAGRRSARSLCVDGLEPTLCDGAGVGAALALAARGVGDVGCDAHVREQQRLLGQHGDAACVRGHEHAGAGVGDHRVAEFDSALVGPQQPGDQQQQCGFPGAVGPEHGEYVAVVEVQIELDAALLEAGLHADAAHTGPPGGDSLRRSR